MIVNWKKPPQYIYRVYTDLQSLLLATWYAKIKSSLKI